MFEISDEVSRSFSFSNVVLNFDNNETFVCTFSFETFSLSPTFPVCDISPFKSIFKSLFNNEVEALTLPVCPLVLSFYSEELT